MKLLLQLESHLQRIEGISYENQNGGAYAYLQFLAYSRELLSLLRPFEKTARQVEALEGINWLFNECLAARFTHRQKAIFENKLSEARQIFDLIRMNFKEAETEKWESDRLFRKQAA